MPMSSSFPQNRRTQALWETFVRIGTLISEIGSLRLLQQQDQTLRAREQDLRAKMQQALSDLVRRSGPSKDRVDVSRQTVAAKITADPVTANPVGKAGVATKSDPVEPREPGSTDGPRMEIPAFLANGPRVGFDRAVADDIREIHGPGGATGEAPIKRLLARIRARNEAR